MVRNPMCSGWCCWLHSRQISASVTETWITCCICSVLDREMFMSIPKLKFFLWINQWRVIFRRNWKCVDCITMQFWTWMIIYHKNVIFQLFNSGIFLYRNKITDFILSFSYKAGPKLYRLFWNTVLRVVVQIGGGSVGIW